MDDGNLCQFTINRISVDLTFKNIESGCKSYTYSGSGNIRLSPGVELEGDWSQTEELLYCLFYVKSLQQAGELGEEEADERLGRMGQSGASILPRKTAGPVPCFDKGNRPYGLFDTRVNALWLQCDYSRGTGHSFSLREE
jgi:hypothetical protein